MLACRDILCGPGYEVSHDCCTIQMLAYTFIAETVMFLDSRVFQQINRHASFL